MQELSDIIEMPTVKDSRGQPIKKAEMVVEEIRSLDRTEYNDYLDDEYYLNDVMLRGRLFNNWRVRTRKTTAFSIKIPNNLEKELWSCFVGELYKKIAPEVLPTEGDIVAVSWGSKRIMPNYFQGEMYVNLAVSLSGEELTTSQGISAIYCRRKILMRRAGDEPSEDYRNQFESLFKQ
jgi:hypothetical protein